MVKRRRKADFTPGEKILLAIWALVLFVAGAGMIGALFAIWYALMRLHLGG